MNLQDIKLFHRFADQPVRIEIVQDGLIVYAHDDKLDKSPFEINLQSKSSSRLTIHINDIPYILDISNLEPRAYKLDLKTGKLNNDPWRSDEELVLRFSLKRLQKFNTSMSSIDSTILKHKIFDQGKGASHYQSTSSLRHSIPEVSFTQSSRFPTTNILSTEFNYDIPTTLKSISTSLGYGSKYITPIYVQRNAEQNPAPNAYFEERSKMKQLKKTVWSHNDRFKEVEKLITPSPNAYDVTSQLGKHKPNYTIAAKIKPLATFQESVPAPNVYEIKHRIAEPERFSKIGLGYGQKSDFAKNDNVPGPGEYEIRSVFRSNSKRILRSNVNH